jgi:catechol 2,3-dioxygenase-like lactoylglutathione lyase family enzyme
MRPERTAASRSGPAIESISALTLATQDVGRAVRFNQALGFTLRSGGEDASFTSFHAGPGYLNLIAVPAKRTCPWWGRVIFHVSDVDAFYAHALAAGMLPAGAPRDAPWGERFFHLTDPDGHELSFATPLPCTGVSNPQER